MTATVHVIDDDELFLRSMSRRLAARGYAVATYPSVGAFLIREETEGPGCVLTDLQMPGHDGFFLQEAVAKSANPLPVVFVTGKGDIPATVRAMRAGAEDFLTKRVETRDLVEVIERAVARDAELRQQRATMADARRKLEALDKRELQMLVGIIKGMPIKEMALEYGLSDRTVKYHRTKLTRDLELYAAVDLARFVTEAGLTLEALEKMAASKEMS